MSNKKGMFEKMFDAAEEIVRKMSKPMVRRKIKSSILAAYTDAQNKIDENNAKLIELRSDLKEYDINSILNLIAENKELETMKSGIEEEYYTMFDEQIKPID